MSFSKLPKSFFPFIVIFFLVPGCVAQKKGLMEELYNIDTIVVLPTDTIANNGDEGTKSTPQELAEGASVLDEIMNEYLGNKRGVQFISPEQQETLLIEYNQSRSAQAISIGKKLASDAVLTSRVNRYQERTGQDYSIDQPASISFEYRLMLVSTGQTLCAEVFDETQQSLTENLLSFKKVFKRGGKWIPVRKLAKEGVEATLGDCRFLNK